MYEDVTTSSQESVDRIPCRSKSHRPASLREDHVHMSSQDQNKDRDQNGSKNPAW